MAISNIANINVGLPNDSQGSDSLYQAFIKTRDNFTQLAACASPYNTFTAGNGIQTNTNSNTGTVTITNTGVTNITAGTGITINQGNGDVTISSSGSGNVGVTNVGITSTTLSVSGSPVISSGIMTVNLPTISNVAGSYINPSVTIDSYGRVTSISNNNISGTVTSVGVSGGFGIQVSNSPVTTSGIINITNTGVTRVSAGPGIALSGSNGNVTISATTSRGTVTSVAMVSSDLVITGSPVTTSGTFFVNLPANITASRFISNVANGTAPIQVSSSTQVANLNSQYAGTVTSNAQPNITSIGALASLSVTGNVTTGNLTVNGNITYINVDNLNIQDPIIQLGTGANGGPLTGNDGKDRGTALNYFVTAPYTAFAGYKNSNGKMILATNVSISSDVVSINDYGNTVVGNLEAQGTLQGNVLSIDGNANVGNIGATNGVFTTVAGTLSTASQPNVTSVGILTSLSVSGNINGGNVIATLHVGNLSGTGNSAMGNLLVSGIIQATASNNTVYLNPGFGANVDPAVQSATNNLFFCTNNNFRGGFNTNGTFSVATEASDWNTSFKVIELPNSTFMAHASTSNTGYFGYNAYWSPSNSWKTKATGNGALIAMDTTGTTYFFRSNSAAAGSNVSFTQTATFDSNGRMGLGTTPSNWNSNFTVSEFPNSSFVAYYSTGNAIWFGTNGYFNPSNQWIAKSTGKFSSVVCDKDGNTSIYSTQFGAAANQGDPLTLQTTAKFTDTGNLLINKSTEDATSENGFLFTYNGAAYATVSSTYGITYTWYVYDRALGGGYKFYVGSDGGVRNYSANNVNLSDARTKTDIENAGNYLDRLCLIPVRTFKYKNQNDDIKSIGIIAQEVEQHIPELISNEGFGDTPEDGIPYKAIYQTDLQYVLMKCIQEQQVMIQEQHTLIEKLNDRLTLLEGNNGQQV